MLCALSAAIWRRRPLPTCLSSGLGVMSSYSSPEGANCVETATLPGWHLVRDSKLGDASPVLKFSAPQRSAFVAGLKL